MSRCGRPAVVALPDVTRSKLLRILSGTRWFLVDDDEEPVYFTESDCVLFKATASIRLSSDVVSASEMEAFGLRTASIESYPATFLYRGGR